MGTRHLIIVQKDGEYKIAQYGQWDGYPEGQGATVLSFLSTPQNIARLSCALDRVRFLDKDKDQDFLSAYEKAAPEWSSDPDHRTPEQIRWFKTLISRDIGGEILENVAHADDGEILLQNELSFAGNSLFCEWAYVVDLDNRQFEVYKGFNHAPVTEGRFQSRDERLKSTEDYEPIALVKSYSLDNLPTEKAFLSELETLTKED